MLVLAVLEASFELGIFLLLKNSLSFPVQGSYRIVKPGKCNTSFSGIVTGNVIFRTFDANTIVVKSYFALIILSNSS